MRNGQCPQCGSSTVFSLANGVVPGGRDRVYIHLDGYYVPVDVASYLCTTCGHFENYITDTNKLSAVAQKWQKVAPHAP
jgi:hypothetical protein